MSKFNKNNSRYKINSTLKKGFVLKNWQIDRFVYKTTKYEIYETSKEAPGNKNYRLSAKLVLFPLPNDRWQERFLLDRLFDINNNLCKNFNFLPESIGFYDKIEFKNKKFAAIFFYGKYKFTSIGKRKIEEFQIKNIVKTLAYNLLILHREMTIMQEINPKNINFQGFINNPFTIIKNGNRYDKDRAVLNPNSTYCAPECYDDNKIIDVQSDVYALGKFTLQLIMGNDSFFKFFNKNFFPQKKDYEPLINGLNVSPGLKTFLLRCLAYEKGNRFRDIWECINYLKNINNNNSISTPVSVYTERMQSISLITKFGGIIKNKHINKAKINLFLKQSNLKKDKDVVILPQFMKFNPRFKNLLDSYKRNKTNVIFENKIDTIDFNGKMVIINEGDSNFIKEITKNLSKIDQLYYFGPKNPFSGNSNVEFYNLNDYLRDKTYK